MRALGSTLMRGWRRLTKQEMDYRLQRLKIVAPWRGRTMVTLAVAVPAGITTWLLQAFAGKATSLNVSIVASLSLGANVVMGSTVWRKARAMNEQSKEMNRLRGRLEACEEGTLGLPPRKSRGKKS